MQAALLLLHQTNLNKYLYSLSFELTTIVLSSQDASLVFCYNKRIDKRYRLAASNAF